MLTIILFNCYIYYSIIQNELVMKQKNFLASLLVLSCMLFCSNYVQAQIGPVVRVSETQQSLPDAVQNFIMSYFPNAAVAYAEFEISDNYYDITLNNGYELELRPNADWLTIEAPKGQAISEPLLKGLLFERIYEHLKHKNKLDKVEEIQFYPIKGLYKVDCINSKDYWFDINGHSVRKPQNPQ